MRGIIICIIAGALWAGEFYLPKDVFERIKGNTVDLSKLNFKKGKYVPDEVIVGFEKEFKDYTLNSLSSYGFTLKKTNDVLNFAVFKIPSGFSVEDALSYIKNLNLKGIRYAEPNYYYYIQVKHWVKNIRFYDFPPDILFDKYQYNFWGPNMPRFIKAWKLSKGKRTVIVGVIDTGCSYETTPIPGVEKHGGSVVGNNYIKAEEFNNINFVVQAGAGQDIVHNDDHPNAENPHGTHVTATIAQGGGDYTYTVQNGKLAGGLTGIAPNVSIMPIKVLDWNGSGTLDNVATGIQLATDLGADIINLSLGGSHSQTMANAVAYAYSNGVLVVAASGNSGTSPVDCPADEPGAIAVGAIDYGQNLTNYSNYGADQELVAPGGENEDLNGDGIGDWIWQIAFREDRDQWTGNVTAVYPESLAVYGYSGTSMATPHVSGLAALVKSINPSLTNVQIRNILQNTAVDLGAAGWDQTFGYGMIDAWKACSTAASQRANPLVILDSVYVKGDRILMRTDNKDTLYAIPWPGGNASMTVWVINYGGTGNVSVQLTTSDPDITIINGTANLGSVPHGARVSNSGSPFTFSISGTATPGKRVLFSLIYTEETEVDTEQFYIYIGKPQILLVEDDYHSLPLNVDGNTNYVLRNHYEKYENVLNAFKNTYPDSNYHFAIWDVAEQGEPSYNWGFTEYGWVQNNGSFRGESVDDIKGYHAIVWFTGQDYFNVFPFPTKWSIGGNAIDIEETHLRNFLNGGGDLFFSSQDYIYADYGSADPYNVGAGTFARDFFGLRRVDQNVYSNANDQANGTYAGPPRTNDLSYTVDNRGGGAGDAGWPTNYTDAFTQINSTGIFNNAGGTPAGIRYENATAGWKTIYLAQPFENYVGGDTVLFMNRVLLWFDVPAYYDWGLMGVNETYFSASQTPEGVVLKWNLNLPAKEIHIEKKKDNEFNVIAVLESHIRTYLDREVKPGIKYYYRLVIIRNNGKIDILGPIEVLYKGFTELSLYPVDFYKKGYRIRFSLPQKASIELSLFNAMGQKEILYKGLINPGTYTIYLNKHLPRGVYFIGLKYKGKQIFKKFVNMK